MRNQGPKSQSGFFSPIEFRVILDDWPFSDNGHAKNVIIGGEFLNSSSFKPGFPNKHKEFVSNDSMYKEVSSMERITDNFNKYRR